MRIKVIGTNTITYPSEVCYAFNRNIVKLQGTINTSYTLTITLGTKSYSDTRTMFNGGVVWDISKYLQMFFKKEEIISGVVQKDIYIAIPDADFSASVKVIWGCVNITDRIQEVTDTINDGKVSFFGFALDSFKTYIRSARGSIIEVPNSKLRNGINTLSLADFDLTDAEKVYVDMIVKADRSTFDDSFDIFFLWANVQQVRYTFIKECENGLAVRWIDNLGLWHKRSFMQAQTRLTTALISDQWNDYQMSEDDATNGFYGFQRQQGYETSYEQQIGIPNATKEEWRVLKTIVSSPIVQANINDAWYDVNVPAGTLEIPSGNIEDFSINVQFPNLISQSL